MVYYKVLACDSVVNFVEADGTIDRASSDAIENMTAYSSARPKLGLATTKRVLPVMAGRQFI